VIKDVRDSATGCIVANPLTNKACLKRGRFASEYNLSTKKSSHLQQQALLVLINSAPKRKRIPTRRRGRRRLMR